MIARALMGAPELLVLEDPSAGLAPPAIDAVAEAIAGPHGADRRRAARARPRAADRIVLVEDDAVVLDAPRAEALADERLGVGYYLQSSALDRLERGRERAGAQERGELPRLLRASARPRSACAVAPSMPVRRLLGS